MRFISAVQVSTGIKSLYSLYGDEFMAALKRCMEQDTVQAHKESTLKNWVALLHSVQTEDTKQVCFVLIVAWLSAPSSFHLSALCSSFAKMCV